MKCYSRVDRQAEHPLPHGSIRWKDIVHQSRRRVRHPPAGARWTKAAPLAGVTRQSEVRRLGALQERLQMLHERAMQNLPLRLAPPEATRRRPRDLPEVRPRQDGPTSHRARQPRATPHQARHLMTDTALPIPRPSTRLTVAARTCLQCADFAPLRPRNPTQRPSDRRELELPTGAAAQIGAQLRYFNKRPTFSIFT